MSQQYECDYDIDTSSIQPISHETVLESVDSLRMWVSAVEEKVTNCREEIEKLNDSVQQNETTLTAILSSLKVLTSEIHSKERIKRMTECNRELGLALSVKIFRSEAKRSKTNETAPLNTFHPSVLPFIFSDTESTDTEEEKQEK